MQNESGLFEIRLTEDGKKFIRKFVAISYTLMVLVVFESVYAIYLNVRVLVTRYPVMSDSPGFTLTTYDLIMPYFSIVSSMMGIVSNIYYTRFPRVLLRSIELNDEFGANRAFSLLFKGGLIFLVWLLLNTAGIIWFVTIR